ncbi:MAG: hypothetical protein EDM03_10305 [Porphyrobacter sp. IPPAS B-1204]|nr:MAG: hypothetical protein EDM03_10305 [Porphyrobacter sp. IPPAS B-1204]
MGMRRALIPLLCLGLVACAEGAGDRAADDAALIAQDPVIARALNDPLMSDPDLASRNEANAAIGWADSHALPVLPATRESASAAREAMRLELLEQGPIPNLPPAPEGRQGKRLGPLASAGDLLAVVKAPASCAGRLKEDFALAASLPPVASLPPQGMVTQAGGSDAKGCRLRIVRYHSHAAPEDVLQYHYARGLRAGLTARRYAEPEASIIASSKGGETLAVHVRPGVHGLTSVDLVYLAP